MSRLTVNLKKQYDEYNLSLPCFQGAENAKKYVSPYKENLYLPKNNVSKRDCYKRLGELEDIEERLGCSLETLENLQKVEIWVVEENYHWYDEDEWEVYKHYFSSEDKAKAFYDKYKENYAYEKCWWHYITIPEKVNLKIDDMNLRGGECL